MTCQVYVTKEEKLYVATDIASGVASQGTTMETALSNLKEALELYYEDDDAVRNNSPAFFTTLEVLA
ncbi:MAG: type II toxin-antitoxin system HicB family antitoxin [Lachnospiraceae bacterium]|nr:type II toxin-antitoxin system HicB family antitoxin [Lachnospiraceae bacterium]